MKQTVLLAALLVILPVGLGGDTLPRRAGDAPSTSGDDMWPGWRGERAEGRTSRALPTHWTETRGIRWKTPIPGRGHSSPIVLGDRVYVTTSYQTVRGRWLQNLLAGATLFLNVVVATFALRLVAVICRRPATHPWRAFGSGVTIVAAVLTLIIVDTCGDAMLDLSRSPIRQWIVATLFVSCCCGLTAFAAETRWLRLTAGLVAIAFGGVALCAFPAPDYVFRGGLHSLRTQVAAATIAVPILVGLTALLAGPAYSRGPAMRRVMVTCAVIVVVGGIAALLHHLLIFRDDSFPETSYTPRIWPAALALPLAASRLFWLAWQGRSTLPVNLSSVSLGGLSVVITLVATVEWLATRSSYLAYQLGSRQFETMPEGLQAAGLGFALVSAVGLARVADNGARLPGNRAATALGLVALLLGAVFFIHVNYANPITELTRAIVSLDRQSGRIAWIRGGLAGPTDPIDGRNSPATPTPATDGRNVCAYFGTAGLMCADTGGRLAWLRTDLPYGGLYGPAFSPVVADGLVVLVRDTPAGTAFVDALDATSGATRWARTFESTPTFSGNSRTPLLREVEGRQTLILWGMNYVKGLALADGEVLWSYGHDSGGDVVSSAISDAERLYLSDAGGTVALDAAALAGGDEPVRWRSDARANCASPVLVNGMIFTVSDSGVAAAIRVSTGERLWRRRLPGQYFASLIASPGAVYFTNSEGLTTVVAADGSFRIVAENHLGEETVASMAAAGGGLFVRSTHHLYAIGND